MAQMEQVLRASPSELDLAGSVTITRMLDWMQRIADEHANVLGVGREEIRKKNLVWILARNAVSIDREIKVGEQVKLLTWTGANTRASLPRHFTFMDESGNRFGSGTAIWILLDSQTKHIVSAAKAGFPEISPTLGHREIEAPQLPKLSHVDWSRARTPKYTEIDINGHLNNVHYAGWVLDELPLEWLKQYQVGSLQMNYHREILPGDQCTLDFQSEDCEILVCGRSETQNILFFQARLKLCPRQQNLCSY